jgi:hypothetical protein
MVLPGVMLIGALGFVVMALDFLRPVRPGNPFAR